MAPVYKPRMRGELYNVPTVPGFASCAAKRMAAGEFSGYYCKLTSVTDGKLLCIESRSRVEDTWAITYVDQGPERFVDPNDYGRFEPKQPLDYQQWLMLWMDDHKAYKIINRNSGLLLCVEGRSHDEKHVCIQYRDQGLSFQWWKVEAFSDSAFKLVNLNSSKVLARSGDSAVQQTTNDDYLVQQWTITSLVFSGYVGEYKIQNVNAQKLLCIEGRSISDEADAVIYEDQTLNFQWWRLFVHEWDDGNFEIQNTQSGKLLCIKGRSKSDEADAIQYYDQELPFQKWRLVEVGSSGQVKVVNINSGRLLCVKGRSTGNSAQVIQYHDQDLSFQWWEFVKRSGATNLVDLIRFYNSPATAIPRVLSATLEPQMCDELLLWYQNFIQTFAMEVLGFLGVLPSPSLEDLATISDLVIGDSTVFGQLQVILGAAITTQTVITIVQLFWDHDLWSDIFRLLLQKIWSLPTLVKATATIATWLAGGGTARTAIMLTKSVIVLGLLYKDKPECN